MKITFLGTGNAFAPQRDWGCILVNESILLDAGPSLLVNLKRLALDPTRINYIFITHFHADHFFGLPFLLLEYLFVSPTDTPLTIIGPPGVEALIRNTMTLAYPDIMQHGWPRPIRFVEAQPGAATTIDDLTFTAVEMDHGTEIIIPYGYRIMLPDGELAYSGDTRMTEALFDLVEQAHVLILEATSGETSSIHLGRDALRQILPHLMKDSVVFLNHLDTLSADPWSDFNVIIPHDLQTYQLDLSPEHSPEVRHA